MRRITHKLTTSLGVALIAGILSACFSMFQMKEVGLVNFLSGLLDGAVIGFLLAAYTMFGVRGMFSQLERRAPFAIVLAVNTLVYFVIFIFARAFLIYATNRGPFLLFPYDRTHFQEAAAFAAVLSLLINFFIQAGQLLGQNTLWNFVRGRYHRGREEMRFIMYLDLAGSTSIGETIGNVKYLQLLDDFFHDMTDAALETGAEIHKYVGDEAILTWTAKKGAANRNCLRFMDLFSNTLNAARSSYERRYGLFPEFRAGLHFGAILAGEIGDLRKEVAYLGDAMNTGSRVLDAAKSLGRAIVISEDARAALGAPPVEDLGEHRLKGKTQSARLYAPQSSR